MMLFGTSRHSIGCPLIAGELGAVISVALFIYIGFIATRSDLLQKHGESFAAAE